MEACKDSIKGAVLDFYIDEYYLGSETLEQGTGYTQLNSEYWKVFEIPEISPGLVPVKVRYYLYYYDPHHSSYHGEEKGALVRYIKVGSLLPSVEDLSHYIDYCTEEKGTGRLFCE